VSSPDLRAGRPAAGRRLNMTSQHQGSGTPPAHRLAVLAWVAPPFAALRAASYVLRIMLIDEVVVHHVRGLNSWAACR